MIISRARISKINRDLDTIDVVLQGEDANSVQTDIPLTQPYVGRGWGIRVGAEQDSLLMIDQDTNGAYKVVGYLPDSRFFKDGADALSVSSNFQKLARYKLLKEGELVVQSKQNSQLFLDDQGSAKLSTSDGNSITIYKSTDTIELASQNATIATEGSKIQSGIVARDLRTEQEKIEDLFLESLLGNLEDSREVQDQIGVDPNYKIADDFVTLQGIFDPEEGSPSILQIPGLKQIKKASKIVDNIKNPALTEHRLEVYEFSDGISSANLVEDAKLLKQGRLPLNLAARQVFGTVVNKNGAISRFDYVFGSGKAKGHGEVWKLPRINEKQSSADFKFDGAKTIQDPVALGSDLEWRVQDLDHFNAATHYQLLLNTRGADHQGNIPSSTSIGSIWSFQVDKEGLTKWNIPASTSLGEPFRNGRSLLWNMDGSLTHTIGKEDNGDLENITGKGWDVISDEQVEFVNVESGRLQRSLTLDLEGSEEKRIGADTKGQSTMIQADGALAFFYGKAIATSPSIVSNPSVAGLDAPTKSSTREGVSIAGRTSGSVEFDIGVNDDTNRQSLGLLTSGVSLLSLGTDEVKDSLKVQAGGNIRFEVLNGGHKFEMFSADSPGEFKDGIILAHGTGAVMQIDRNGVITIRNSEAQANIVISQAGDITAINPSGKISLGVDGTIGIGSSQAGIDISPTLGVVLRTPGGSFTLTPEGKVEIAANAGCTVTGPFFHANTTSTLLSPGAATSPFTVAAAGGGVSMDPLTGHSVSGFSSIKG